jgi:L-ascorbate metabolism protein UlaG (beta-lactamase superfamily)
MKVTYVRWSMTIIETDGLVLVTDPVFRMFGIHQAPRSYTFDRLPRPDFVFISHTHVDHFEPATVRRLPFDTPAWMPAEKAHRASSLGLERVTGVHQWESSEFRGIRMTAVPAQHPGGELGLVIEGERTVYFAGDTSIDRDLFRTIGQRWDLDAVLLPIGDLRSLGLPFRELGPRQAPRALRLLAEPRVVVPIHYSGMTLGPLMYFRGTPRKLSEAIDKAGLGTIVGTTRPLETVEF